MNFLFTNAAMLAGLAALAIPVVIHLLLKRKKQRLRFSTLRFFQQQDEQSSQRRKLRNLFLLSLRTLLLTLLVLAFARPFLPKGGAQQNNRERVYIAFVLDRSASMQATGSGSSRWEQAVASIEDALSALEPDDRVALIGCAKEAEVLSGFAPPDTIRRLLPSIAPSYETADLSQGIKMAAKLFSGAPSGASTSLNVVSDLQNASSRNMENVALSKFIKVNFIRVGEEVTLNMAIANLSLEQSDTAKPHLALANFGRTDSSEIKVALSIDGKEVLQRTAPLQTGTISRVELDLPVLPSGWHTAEATILGEDAFALDNSAYAAFYVPEPVRILVLENRGGKKVYEEETYFFTRALNPLETTNGASFVIQKTTLNELPALLEKASSFDVVALPNVAQTPAGLAQRLLAFVQNGGGLLLFVGDNINADNFNAGFSELLPARLGRLERNTSAYASERWHLERYDPASPIFAAFRQANSGNLFLPEFTKRFTLQPHPESSVPAEFEDGVAAMVSRRIGPGQVMLVNTTVDTAWTDWPKHKTFVPWLHGLCRQISRRPERGREETELRLAEKNSHITLGSRAKENSYQISRGTEQPISVKANAEGELEGIDLGRPGVYTIFDQGRKPVRHIAVNVAGEESDLTARNPEELNGSLARVDPAAKSVMEAGFFGSTDKQTEYWRLLLMGCLGLLLLEVFVANRTYA